MIIIIEKTISAIALTVSLMTFATLALNMTVFTNKAFVEIALAISPILYTVYAHITSHE
jgi:hypothetical protein